MLRAGGERLKPTPRARLAFVEEHGTPNGFRTGEGTTDEVVVRELVQNALDADATAVGFRTVQRPVEDIPAIADYRTAVEAIHPDAAATPTGQSALERINGALGAESVTCLLCADDGEGLSLSAYRRLVATAMSSKVGEEGRGKLGSVGVGHLTALDASAMRYVLYFSDGSAGPLFGGQALLATQKHPGPNGGTTHRTSQGCLTDEQRLDGFRGYEARPADPQSTPEWMSLPPGGGDDRSRRRLPTPRRERTPGARPGARRLPRLHLRRRGKALHGRAARRKPHGHI